MSFKEFDMSEIENAKEQYAKEVEARWGATDAYKQNKEKIAHFKKDDWKRVTEEMDDLLKKFANHINENPSSAAVQELVGEWKQYITDNYYDCTNEILSGLGKMYVLDERFTKNMDKFKTGTTKLISEAIEIYCNN